MFKEILVNTVKPIETSNTIIDDRFMDRLREKVHEPVEFNHLNILTNYLLPKLQKFAKKIVIDKEKAFKIKSHYVVPYMHKEIFLEDFIEFVASLDEFIYSYILVTPITAIEIQKGPIMVNGQYLFENEKYAKVFKRLEYGFLLSLKCVDIPIDIIKDKDDLDWEIARHKAVVNIEDIRTMLKNKMSTKDALQRMKEENYFEYEDMRSTYTNDSYIGMKYEKTGQWILTDMVDIFNEFIDICDQNGIKEWVIT